MCCFSFPPIVLFPALFLCPPVSCLQSAVCVCVFVNMCVCVCSLLSLSVLFHLRHLLVFHLSPFPCLPVSSYLPRGMFLVFVLPELYSAPFGCDFVVAFVFFTCFLGDFLFLVVFWILDVSVNKACFWFSILPLLVLFLHLSPHSSKPNQSVFPTLTKC